MRLGEQVGLALGFLADVEIDEGLKMACEHGYAAVEILGDESFSDQGFRGLWPWEERIWNHIQPLLEPFPFKAYHAPYESLNYLTLNPVMRETTLEQIKTAIDRAAEMGFSPVIVHPGKPRSDMNQRVVDLLVTTFLTEIAAYAEEKQIKVAVECSEYFADLSILEHYISKVQSPYLGVSLDLSPEMVLSNELTDLSLEKYIQNLGDRIFHCRLHGMDEETALTGVGYEQVLKNLINRGYQGAVIFQIVSDAIDSVTQTRNVIYKVG